MAVNWPRDKPTIRSGESFQFINIYPMTYPKCRQLSHCNDDGDGWSLGLGWATKARCQHQSQPSNFLEFSPLQPAFFVNFSVNFEVRKNICIIVAAWASSRESSPNIFVLFLECREQQRAAAAPEAAVSLTLGLGLTGFIMSTKLVAIMQSR